MGPPPQTSFVSGGFPRAMLAGDRLKDRLKERPASPSHSLGWFSAFSAFITIVITTMRLELQVVSSTCFYVNADRLYCPGFVPHIVNSLVEETDLQGTYFCFGTRQIAKTPWERCCPVVSDFVVGPFLIIRPDAQFILPSPYKFIY